MLISACTSSNKLTPSYDAGLNDSEFEPRTDGRASSETLDGTDTSEDGVSTEPLDSIDSTATSEPPATEAVDRDAGADAGTDAG